VQRERPAVDESRMPLDPTLDVVFKLMLCREPALLRDMLECTLARPVVSAGILNPSLLGDRVRDKQVHLDVRTALDDGSRADLEMQRRSVRSLVPRLLIYGARDYAAQLVRGEDYSRLTPTRVIAWLGEPLPDPPLDRLHSIFELRERHTHVLLSDHLSFHLLQLSNAPSLPQPEVTGYAAQVERWARFFTARDEAALAQLAAEDPTMHLATQTLEELSQDPEACRLALERAQELALYRYDLATSRDEGREEGRRGALAETLLKFLDQRFGQPPAVVQALVRAATAQQLDAWLGRVLTARSVDEIFAR